MSLKYTYHNIISLILAALVAWNSFGFVGVMIGSLAMQEMHNHEEQCEKMFCYCEVSDGMKICVCHHQNDHDMPDEEHHGPSDCFLDLDIKGLAHDASLIQWDSRTFILYEALVISPSLAIHEYPTSPPSDLEQGIPRVIEHPPAFV